MCVCVTVRIGESRCICLSADLFNEITSWLIELERGNSGINHRYLPTAPLSLSPVCCWIIYFGKVFLQVNVAALAGLGSEMVRFGV